MGFFGNLIGAFTGAPQQENADRQRQIAQQYGQQAQGYLGTGYDRGIGSLDRAVSAYTPVAELGQNYNRAGGLSLDALGVNGPEGFQRAQQAFQTTPGYQASLDQGLESILRNRAIGGTAASGGTNTDLLKYATGQLYGTQYAPWLASLERAGTLGGQYTTAAAGGQAGAYGGMADLAAKLAQAQSGVAGNVASGMTNASNTQMAGELAAGQNALGLVKGIGGLGMNFLPGGQFANVFSGGTSLFGPSSAGQPWSSYEGPRMG